jgi:hypothetical protein
VDFGRIQNDFGASNRIFVQRKELDLVYLSLHLAAGGLQGSFGEVAEKDTVLEDRYTH